MLSIDFRIKVQFWRRRPCCVVWPRGVYIAIEFCNKRATRLSLVFQPTKHRMQQDMQWSCPLKTSPGRAEQSVCLRLSHFEDCWINRAVRETTLKQICNIPISVRFFSRKNYGKMFIILFSSLTFIQGRERERGKNFSLHSLAVLSIYGTSCHRRKKNLYRFFLLNLFQFMIQYSSKWFVLLKKNFTFDFRRLFVVVHVYFS